MYDRLTAGTSEWCRFPDITIIRIMCNIIVNEILFARNHIVNGFDDNITV